MILHIEVTLILGRNEITPSVAKLIEGWVATGSIRTQNAVAVRISCVNELDAKCKMNQVDMAWEADREPIDKEEG